ncbi:MAG TPA: hypothetical protein VKS25_01395 [Solirubrobacteraceae bacterium]|nr:hypothetical protein [Solirubrobacteraceae bacterium]
MPVIADLLSDLESPAAEARLLDLADKLETLANLHDEALRSQRRDVDRLRELAEVAAPTRRDRAAATACAARPLDCDRTFDRARDWWHSQEPELTILLRRIGLQPDLILVPDPTAEELDRRAEWRRLQRAIAR